MNREIKFRAWDTFNLRMVYDPYYFRKRDEPDLEDERFNSPMQYAEHWQDLDDGIWLPCHLMQYTGLKDQANKDIYDKDILSKKWIAEVYCENTGAWMVKFHNNTEHNKSITLFSFLKLIKKAGTNEAYIAGNIYETPELL